MNQVSDHDAGRFGKDPELTFVRNVEVVQERIAAACKRAGRNSASVRLLPISKTVPAHVLRLAYSAGLSAFGENRIQEAAAKAAALADLPLSWSIVGHLQSNKIKQMSRFASEFHALDSITLATQLNRQVEALGRKIDVYIQVNTSGEDSKYGLQPSVLTSFVDRLSEFRALRPRGLMTLAVLSGDPGRVRPCFKLLRNLRDEAVRRCPALTELSMGMSGDFQLAIEEGADVVRIGQAIFGLRPTPDHEYWPPEPDRQERPPIQ